VAHNSSSNLVGLLASHTNAQIQIFSPYIARTTCGLLKNSNLVIATFILTFHFPNNTCSFIDGGKHRSRWLLIVFVVRVEALCGSCSLKLAATLAQRLVFFWSAMTMTSMPLLIQALSNCWSSLTFHFLAPITTPSIFPPRFPHQYWGQYPSQIDLAQLSIRLVWMRV